MEILVDDATTPDLVHQITVQHRRVLEHTPVRAARVVAAILGEEGRHRVVGKRICPLLVATRLEGALSTPLVDIVPPKVHRGCLIGAAVEVVGEQIARLGVVIGRVPNADPATKVLARNVCLAVAHSGLDKRRRVAVGLVVSDLVAGKEAQRVLVLAQVVDDASVPRVEVCRPRRAVAVDGFARYAQVSNHIDARGVESIHARGVVGRRIDGVHTDGVGAKLLQERDITLAAGSVG